MNPETLTMLKETANMFVFLAVELGKISNRYGHICLWGSY
jgi:hypothetical protein